MENQAKKLYHTHGNGLSPSVRPAVRSEQATQREIGHIDPGCIGIFLLVFFQNASSI
jgi:hypothetical protein